MRNNFWLLTILLACGTAWGQEAASPGGDPVTVKLFWNYDTLPKEMKVYELKPGEQKKLWDTDVVKSPDLLPVGNAIADDTLFLKTGQNKKFVLVYRNTTGQTLHFFAAPHKMTPEANALGYKFKCLCINRVYEVQPGAYWYRVVGAEAVSPPGFREITSPSPFLYSGSRWKNPRG